MALKFQSDKSIFPCKNQRKMSFLPNNTTERKRAWKRVTRGRISIAWANFSCSVRRMSFENGQTFSREIWQASSGLQSLGAHQMLSRSLQPFRFSERRFKLLSHNWKAVFLSSTYTRITLNFGHLLGPKFMGQLAVVPGSCCCCYWPIFWLPCEINNSFPR